MFCSNFECFDRGVLVILYSFDYDGFKCYPILTTGYAGGSAGKTFRSLTRFRLNGLVLLSGLFKVS